jgi:hypothetical protein
MPLIYTTLFLAISTFETPPSFLWSVKTQSVQVLFRERLGGLLKYDACDTACVF